MLGPKGVVVLFAIPVIWWLLQDYHRIYALGFIAILVIDEFPGGLGEVPERSLRTTFYSKSVGIPGFYLPDLLLFGFLGLYILQQWAKKSPNPFVFDYIGRSLALLCVCIVLSTFTSLLSFDFGAHYIVQQSTFTSFEINQKGLKLIGFFQVKLFFAMFPAYLATMVFLQNHGLKKLMQLFAIAISLASLIGLMRFASKPGLLLSMTPVVYDSATVILFCLCFMHFLYLFFKREYVRGSDILTLIIIGIFLFLILSSFRRTIWGAFILVMMSYAVYLWSLEQKRAFNLLSVVIVMGALVMASPIGIKMISLILGRLFETSNSDPSTLYRFVLFKYFVENIGNIPFFGYGIKPLWNEIIRLRFFEANLENVHSLYYWVVLRFGILGMLGFTVAGLLIRNFYKKLRLHYQGTIENQYLRMFGYFFFMYLFSGVFNPVYAQFRYAFILGVIFACMSYMGKQMRKRNDFG